MTDCDGLITSLRNANNAAGGVLDLEAIKARAAAATEGPWRTDGILHDQAEDGHPVLGGGEPGSMAEHMVTWVGEFCNTRADVDAVFIAAARADVPALVAEVEWLRAIVDAALREHWQTTQVWGGERRKACGRCVYGDGVHYLWPCPTRQALTGYTEPAPDVP